MQRCGMQQTYVGLVCGKSMVNTGGQNDEIVFVKMNANPALVFAPYVKVALAATDVTNLLVLVKVLVEEGLDLFFVHRAHLFRRDKDLITVLVASFLGKFIHTIDLWYAIVYDTELAQCVGVDSLAGVVRQSLVALDCLVSCCHSGIRRLTAPTGRLSYIYAFILSWRKGMRRGKICRPCRQRAAALMHSTAAHQLHKPLQPHAFPTRACSSRANCNASICRHSCNYSYALLSCCRQATTKKRAALQAPSRGRYGLVKIVFGVGLQSGAHSISYIVSQTPCPKHKSLYKQDSGRVFLHLHSRSIFRGAPKMPNAMMCLASLGDGGIADPNVYHFVHAVGRGPRRPALKKHAPPAWRVQGPRAVV